MKTMAPSINITEAEEKPMEVENFQAVKRPAFASDLQEANWEKMTGIPAKEMNVLLIMGTINGETVATNLYSEYPLTTDQIQEILKIIYSCRYEQITEQFDERLRRRILALLDPPDFYQNAKVVVGYDFDRGVISCIAIYPDWRKNNG